MSSHVDRVVAQIQHFQSVAHAMLVHGRVSAAALPRQRVPLGLDPAKVQHRILCRLGHAVEDLRQRNRNGTGAAFRIRKANTFGSARYNSILSEMIVFRFASW